MNDQLNDLKTLTEAPLTVLQTLYKLREAVNFYHIDGGRLTDEQANLLADQLRQIAIEAEDILPKLEHRYKIAATE